MKIVLVRPPRVFEKYNKALKPAPPLGIALLASVLEDIGHDVQLIDGIVEGLDEVHHFIDNIYIQGLNSQQILNLIDKDTDVIGFSCMFTADWLYTKNLINVISNALPQAKIILGGEHVSALPEQCMSDCPSVFAIVLGEGEETIAELIEAIKNQTPISTINGLLYKNNEGLLIKTPKRNRIKNIDNIPIPKWDLLPVQTYFEKKLNFGVSNKKTLPILATRGCPYKCSFCSSPDMWGTSYYMRSVKNVVDEIEYLVKKYKVDNIDLYDLTAIIKASWILEFCKEILNRNLKITWQLPSGTRTEALNEEVVKYMKMSGCTVVSYAPESGSEFVLKKIHKKVRVQKMLESIRMSNKAGLVVKVNIIIGLPMETYKDIFKTMLFILKCSKNGAFDMGPNPFHPIPGTELFNELITEKKIDLNSNKYYIDLIRADNIFKVKFYNDNIPTYLLKLFFFMYFLTFYISNFLFYPKRLIETIKNVAQSNPKTRGQYVLIRIFEQVNIKTLFKFK